MEAFKFPDEVEDKKDAELEIEIEEDDSGEVEAKAEGGEVDLEVVDDRPDRDKNRKPSKPPTELTDEELAEYSDKVKNRLRHFSKGYHDQRRAAEDAQREREEALRLAQQLVEENKRLKGAVTKNQEVLLEQAKKTANSELEQAKAAYKQAYESGDSDGLLNAEEALANAREKVQRVANFRLPALQQEEITVQEQNTASNQTVADSRALDWQRENKWFGEDDEMTSFALGLHQKLVKQGVDPQTDEYYESINSRMREVFPSKFGRTRKKSNVVAPATRSVAPKKVVLTRSQVNVAKRLGVPLTEYAKQVAEEMRKQNG